MNENLLIYTKPAYQPRCPQLPDCQAGQTPCQPANYSRPHCQAPTGVATASSGDQVILGQLITREFQNKFQFLKDAVGNLEEREDLALNLNKYNFQIPPPPSPLLSCPASKVPPREEAGAWRALDARGVHAIDEARWTWRRNW